MEQYYDWYKVFHIISVICWMAAMFYLPRLFVYHVNAKRGGELDLNLQKMEIRLLRIIMNPAMIFTYIFGLLIAYIYGIEALGVWFHIKFTAVIGLTILHSFFAKCVKRFKAGTNHHSERFFRIINEVPVILMVIIVIMVVVKPFE